MEGEYQIYVEHTCADFLINDEQYKLYQLNLLPLRCKNCGLLPPAQPVKSQSDVIVRPVTQRPNP